MFYFVSFSSGPVGVFSSIEKAKELVFDIYPSITFITQVFKKNNKTEKVVEDEVRIEKVAEVKDVKDEVVRIEEVAEVKEVKEDEVRIEEVVEDEVEEVAEVKEDEVRIEEVTEVKDVKEVVEDEVEVKEDEVRIEVKEVVEESIVWAILYKENDMCAFISDNKEEVENNLTIFNSIGKTYDDSIDYWELVINKIPECIEVILDSLQRVYGENGVRMDSIKNIIYYV